ncbi:MAG: RluA family pseudouridine synthase [Bacteroidales bacterium]|nr:RluA family pseudouridine synthase [Bacteroidales bacterium]MDE6440075.1 RluA family pseudouridine synthase [Bacteroidales bacterium]
MILTADRDTSLIDLLLEAFPDSNRTRLKKAIRLGCVSTADGALMKHAETPLHKGERVSFKRYSARELYREKAPFRILYEDDDLMVVFKPAGILTSGRTTEKVRSMFGIVNSYVLQKTRHRQRAYTVHRLDREVCGLLMFAKNEETKAFLQDHWQEVEKKYYALVEGCPEKASGVCSSFLKENARQVMYSVAQEEAGAKWAVTHYRTLRRHEAEGTALLEVRLETGRKNQIRVHLSDMGCPIVGDRKYGADDSVKRQIRLMAYSLAFPNPRTGRREKVEIGLPKDFELLTGVEQ